MSLQKTPDDPLKATAGPTVFVVDDDLSIRESLESLMAAAGFVPRTFATAREFLRHPRAGNPNCLVLDVGLPDLSGLDLQELVRDRRDMPIIFITGSGDVPTIVRAMKAGAVEFLTKPLKHEVLLDAVRAALAYSRSAAREEADLRRTRGFYASLSGREREVMALVIAGLLNKDVGEELGISEITVKAHRGRVMRKMKASSLADLVRMASKLGEVVRGKRTARRRG